MGKGRRLDCDLSNGTVQENLPFPVIPSWQGRHDANLYLLSIWVRLSGGGHSADRTGLLPEGKDVLPVEK